MEKVDTLEKLSLEEMKQLVMSLEEKVAHSKIELSNVQNTIRTEKMAFDDHKKMSDTQENTNLVVENNRLRKLENSLRTKEGEVELREERFRERLAELEKREQAMLDVEKNMRDLTTQRSNFERYKNQSVEEIEKLKNECEGYKDYENRLKAFQQELNGREIKIKKDEKYLSDRFGELDVLEKQIEEKTKQLESLKSEVVHV